MRAVAFNLVAGLDALASDADVNTPGMLAAGAIPAQRSLTTLLGSLCLLQAATGVNGSICFAFGGFFLSAER